MTFDLFFNVVIYVLIIIVIIFIIKVKINTNRLIVAGSKKYLSLEANLKKEKIKGQSIIERISMLNDLHKNLFNRFFEINKEFIALQITFKY